MKTNFKKIVIVLVIIAIIAGVITYFINKNKKPEYVEYEPQEEISDEQERSILLIEKIGEMSCFQVEAAEEIGRAHV